MLSEGRRAKPAELPNEVQLTSLDGDDGHQPLLEQLARGAPHDDTRDWLRMVDAIGELRVLEGVDADENIGRIAEMLHHTAGSPSASACPSTSAPGS